ncbi:MAG: VWA domain-containing protein [Deltaproteobacteria bacterium]|nr:MAG: VWA domain-containing protein [Deltaproteobacteria bacterium]
MKRRKVNVFSLSFLDCICCGLGAVILLFVIVNAKSAAHRDQVTSDVRGEVTRLKEQVLEGKKGLIEARNTYEETLAELVKTQGLSEQIIKIIQEKKIELTHYQNDTLASKAHINKLKADLKSLEEDVKRLEAGSKALEDYGSKLRSFAGQGKRQYLTDLNLGGDRIFILVDASASMLDHTIVGIVRRRNLDDRQKAKSEKWQHAIATIDWLTTQLPMASKFQVYTFNDSAAPVIEGTKGIWLDAGDVDKLNETVDRLRKMVPEKGTSLLNAFNALRSMSPAPDNIFLLTDSLPTMGKTKSWRKRISGKRRLSLFNDAVRRLPRSTPVNIILYPMEGDPVAASAFWRLAAVTDGSFLCPSRDWP